MSRSERQYKSVGIFQSAENTLLPAALAIYTAMFPELFYWRWNLVI